MNIHTSKNGGETPSHKERKSRVLKFRVLLGAMAVSSLLAMSAAADEIPHTDTEFYRETEAVPEIAVPQMEVAKGNQEPASEQGTEPAVQPQSPPQTEAARPSEPAPAVETESRIGTLTAVSDDGAVEVSVSKKDGSGYAASDGIRVMETDPTEKREKLIQKIMDAYIQSHPDIDWNETNALSLNVAVADSVPVLSAYTVVSGDGSALSMQENTVSVKVLDTEVLTENDGACVLRVYTPSDMQEDSTASEGIDSEDRLFTPSSESFAVAAVKDISFTPVTETPEEMSEPEPVETEQPAPETETVQTESESPSEQIQTESAQETVETEQIQTETETEQTEQTEQTETEPAEAIVETEQAQTEATVQETEETTPQPETDTADQGAPQETVETENTAVEPEFPVHPETAYFAKETEDTYPTESIDGPSPLVADTESEEGGISAGGSFTGETTASEFSGLSNTEAAEKCLELVRRVDNSGIVPSVVTAQMILESGYVRTGLARNANNCFGMKSSLSQNDWSSTWGGQSVNYQTWEQSPNGAVSNPVCSFRVYDSIEQSILDHSGYLREAKNGGNLRYPGVADSRDYTTVANIIKAGGYATDINYVAKLCNIIQTYNLDRYDYDSGSGASHASGESVISEMR